MINLFYKILSGKIQIFLRGTIMTALIFNIISFLLSTLSICHFASNYFLKNYDATLLIIAGVFSFINSIVQICKGDQKNLGTELSIIVGAIIVALIWDLKIFRTICFFLCFAEVMLLLFGWLVTLGLYLFARDSTPKSKNKCYKTKFLQNKKEYYFENILYKKPQRFLLKQQLIDKLDANKFAMCSLKFVAAENKINHYTELYQNNEIDTNDYIFICGNGIDKKEMLYIDYDDLKKLEKSKFLGEDEKIELKALIDEREALLADFEGKPVF